MTVIGSYQVWPEGLTWVFQGTVGEDATGGTHSCSLTVTPGAGNEIVVLGGEIVIGNTATAQAYFVQVTDGTNEVRRILSGSDTSGSITHGFPGGAPSLTTNLNSFETAANSSIIVSGTMSLKLLVQTAAISVTQTFAVVCRIKGSAPTAVLADTVGTPVLTVNTSKVFG